jgi:hypothetical protein
MPNKAFKQPVDLHWSQSSENSGWVPNKGASTPTIEVFGRYFGTLQVCK